VVRWTDSDENDNARISLLLDPDLAATGLDGDEILLVESLGEDADGAGDQVTLGVPAAAAAGEYRVVGTITDGLSQLVTRAPGRLIVFSSGQSGGNPPALPRLALPHPSGPVRTRVGELIPLRIETTNVAGSADIRVRLRSMGEGAAMLDVDVTPAELTLNADTELRVPDAPGIIPNDWWPRSFELSVEVTVNGTQFSAQAPGIVWIRQEVEVRHVTMVNYWCFDAGNAVPVDTPFTGLEIEWFGGGFGPQAGVAPGRVAFWLFNDPIFPGDGVQDARHRIVHEATERANHTRVTRIDYDSLIGRVAELEPSVQAALDSGEYKITTVVNAEIFGQIIAPPHPAPVEVCFPLPFDDASP